MRHAGKGAFRTVYALHVSNTRWESDRARGRGGGGIAFKGICIRLLEEARTSTRLSTLSTSVKMKI